MAAPSLIRWTCARCKESVNRPLVGPGVDVQVGEEAPDYVKIRFRLCCPRCAGHTEVTVGNRPY